MLILGEKVVVRVGVVRIEIWRVGLEMDRSLGREEFHDAEVSAASLWEHLVVRQYLDHRGAIWSHAQEPSDAAINDVSTEDEPNVAVPQDQLPPDLLAVVHFPGPHVDRVAVGIPLLRSPTRVIVA